MNGHSPWINTYRQALQGKARILAFPCSGAGSLAYFKWVNLFRDSGIDFLCVQLPGRENRQREAPLSNVATLVDQLVTAITPLLNKPLVLFGHSLGALLAFEVSRHLDQQGLPLPRHLFVSAFRAPDQPNPSRELHRLTTPQFLRALAEYGGTASEILENRELMELFMPVLRADFTAHETYRYQSAPPLSCPITAFSGTEDSFASPAIMAGWQHQTQLAFEHICFPGGHFFLNEQSSTISQHLRQSFSRA